MSNAQSCSHPQPISSALQKILVTSQRTQLTNMKASIGVPVVC